MGGSAWIPPAWGRGQVSGEREPGPEVNSVESARPLVTVSGALVFHLQETACASRERVSQAGGRGSLCRDQESLSWEERGGPVPRSCVMLTSGPKVEIA